MCGVSAFLCFCRAATGLLRYAGIAFLCAERDATL
jgi:hypothetical protein